VSRQNASIFGVWVLVVVGAVLVGIFAHPADYLGWMPLVLGVGMLAAFAVQLPLRSVEGLVTRLAVTASGSIVLLAIATGVLWLVAQGSVATPQ
jgi:hypothetical protein